MADASTAVDRTEREPIIPDSMWKYFAISAIWLCVGIIIGQYTPNRNIVTQDQLKAMDLKVDALSDKFDTLKDTTTGLSGKVQELIDISQGQNPTGIRPPHR